MDQQMRALKQVMKAIFFSVKRTKSIVLIKDVKILQTLAGFVGSSTCARQDLLNRTIKYWLRSFNTIVFKKVQEE